MDVWAVEVWDRYGDVGGEHDYGGVFAAGFEGKGMGKGACYSYGSPKHFTRERPYPEKTGAKAKDSTESVTIVERRDTPQGTASREKGSK
jgi:hypothetical protein